MLHVTLGMQPGYVWTLNDGAPLQAALGARVELMFMNPTPMMHPMHLHGHHFQVVDVGMGRFAGPMRDTVIVPPMGMVTVAVDLDKAGGWYLHCHHLYHMAGGMMTTLDVA
jgi:FtsP/CotA-like multicopper oxidase with cupredoxin domain